MVNEQQAYANAVLLEAAAKMEGAKVLCVLGAIHNVTDGGERFLSVARHFANAMGFAELMEIAIWHDSHEQRAEVIATMRRVATEG